MEAEKTYIDDMLRFKASRVGSSNSMTRWYILRLDSGTSTVTWYKPEKPAEDLHAVLQAEQLD